MVTFYERKELENRIGRSVSEKEYMGIFEDFIVHTVPANGRLCGAERPRCGASGHPLSYID